MRFGVCMPIEQAEFIAKLGFDYLEVSACRDDRGAVRGFSAKK